MLLAGCALYAGYTVALRDRPQMPALVFFTAMAAAACLSSLPFFAVEFAMGQAYWPTLTGWLILLFVALGPSLTSQVFFMRGVELIGPGRAGLFSNLVPLFGALFAVLLLGEEFHLYHAAAMALGLGGVWLSERKA
jgi:drug/metabolite transporter (DMT)-like permease